MNTYSEEGERSPFDYQWREEEPYEGWVMQARLPYTGEVHWYGLLCQRSQKDRWVADVSAVADVLDTMQIHGNDFRPLYALSTPSTEHLHLTYSIDTDIIYAWRTTSEYDPNEPLRLPPILVGWKPLRTSDWRRT